MSTEVAGAPRPRPARRSRRCAGSRSSPPTTRSGTSAALLAELRALDPGLEVVVISDGSTDRTAEVAAAAGAHVVRLPFNLGIGGAVQTGFRYAWEGGYELAVRVDGDGQHDPAQLGAVVAPVLAGEADIAIGSRFLATGGYRSSAARRIGIRVLARVVSCDRAPARDRHRPRASRR